MFNIAWNWLQWASRMSSMTFLIPTSDSNCLKSAKTSVAISVAWTCTNTTSHHWRHTWRATRHASLMVLPGHSGLLQQLTRSSPAIAEKTHKTTNCVLHSDHAKQSLKSPVSHSFESSHLALFSIYCSMGISNANATTWTESLVHM